MNEYSRIVALKGGGTLRVELSVNLFKLPKEDRALVFPLLDAIREYETKGKVGVDWRREDRAG